MTSSTIPAQTSFLKKKLFLGITPAILIVLVNARRRKRLMPVPVPRKAHRVHSQHKTETQLTGHVSRLPIRMC